MSILTFFIKSWLTFFLSKIGYGWPSFMRKGGGSIVGFVHYAKESRNQRHFSFSHISLLPLGIVRCLTIGRAFTTTYIIDQQNLFI
jgi:hypothetical protein